FLFPRKKKWFLPLPGRHPRGREPQTRSGRLPAFPGEPPGIHQAQNSQIAKILSRKNALTII
ncbi:hypothetical protein, partial [uncultured Intestinimonas sp.]|uniref:hypothetical protein n=1 Tax=uncultured Intestinimonas sp. TaxID=1689265 RepID=UPI0025DB751C